jgi:hypothetical protein
VPSDQSNGTQTAFWEDPSNGQIESRNMLKQKKFSTEVRIAGCKSLLIETKHWYHKGMKRHTSKPVGKKKKNVKSSITLPPAELEIVNELMTKLDAKSKVEVIRQGLALLKLKTDRESLAEQFRHAVKMSKSAPPDDVISLAPLDDELIPPYDEEYIP